MPKITGLQAVTKLKKDNKDIKALFLTMYDSEEYIYQVLKAGGTGLINKNVLEGELEYAIECVYSGKQYFGNKWTDEKLADLINEYDKHSRLIKSETTKLTYREEQVLKFIKNGNTSAQIAEKLGIAKKTVDFHRSLIMQKCNLNSSNALIIFAVKYFEE
jgi:DNA-binding NarL/FixJ family response regulator